MHTLTLVRVLVAFGAAALLLSCAAVPTVQAQQAEPATPSAVRVIVKLHAPADEPTVMRLIGQKLPQPERVSYLRAMSGDAHVLSVAAPATEDDVSELITDLRATKLFEYVELDRMKGIRSNP